MSVNFDKLRKPLIIGGLISVGLIATGSIKEVASSIKDK